MIDDLYNLYLQYQILFQAIFAGILASVSLGIIGTYIVSRRISYVSGAISHCVFGGVGAGIFIQNYIGWQWFDPIYGAIISALVSALIIGAVTASGKNRDDAVIGAMWAVGMSVGIVFIDITPGYFNIASYLFGDILLITGKDLLLIIVVDIFSVLAALMFYRRLMAISFDSEFAAIRGVNIRLYYILLLCLVALVTVVLVRIVGIIMVIALLTMPAAMASGFVNRLWHMMVISIIINIVFVISGLILSYHLALSSSAIIIIILGAFYLLVAFFSRRRVNTAAN
ncbi:MAG: metal ABC transporter permease [Gammaproteobacteria bacterium]|nr:MAG: metal ABC transporter permease [Gammaproteobacteria bacterium]